ncbi:MAG: molybdenum cofactor biosynthesis protein MoaE [Arenimonas sp.]|jgi:molybdopterin synthase catalytic subunit
MHFRITDSAIDNRAWREALADARCGAYASFEGWVRNHHAGRAVLGLHYDCYTELAEHEGERILSEALARFDILDARCIHRIGDCAIGDMAVWVGVGAAHREAAFAACRWIIDEVKSRVPIWKREHYADGDSGWREGEGVAAPAG